MENRTQREQYQKLKFVEKNRSKHIKVNASEKNIISLTSKEKR